MSNSLFQIENSVTAMRSILLGVGGLLVVTGGQKYGYPGAGPLACIISAFVAGTGWKLRMKTQKADRNMSHNTVSLDNDNQEDPVEKVFERIWFGLQPILFASIGTEVKFELLKGGDIIITGIMILMAGLIVSLKPVEFILTLLAWSFIIFIIIVVN